MEEIWKDIKDFEELYQVSNLGRVRSKERVILTQKNKEIYQKWGSKILKPFDNGRGYLTVHLKKQSKRYVKYVHRLVAEAFLGSTINMDINHKDFNRTNNSIDNLEIVTRKENIDYSKKANRYDNVYLKRIEITKQRYNKLKRAIERDLKNGIPVYKIEKIYRVNHSTLRKYGYI